MIDNDGYRANVGIILCNRDKKLFWGHRIGHLDSWQFPQGGIDDNETPEEAMYRELKEEVGLSSDDVKILGKTKSWLRYRLPQRLIRKNNSPRCIGQKQIWFLLELTADEDAIDLAFFDTPEFDHWKWVEYWHPINEVIYFKRKVYNRALVELAPALFKGMPIPEKPLYEKRSEFRPKQRVRRSLFRMRSRN
ncbi:RNA pyrophosphohydrolase [Wohlfahrtiimonas chitiniclastica]|uniref:RNA pyrophosphohydrolase n=2 Tax=Wohlfahrtiimonas chitiniclastica TaxID=400946 RepID=L8XZT2_9GAMM|nr:RNA pyrophosphohydrolase [Wohlfahrtiimonas chitiniclastica]ELV08339.1 RNA pyrophosphohydrolase [Wohlfahrtiimonas chitiniclastica SH04]KZS23268.1 RNA pyrophosphohydrolase [Wohlfahrtiimonas chitiniclastica]KZX37392.1 RNA pyrophosphohydrolase [Wohlfahrtiimonas chitiniclastica]MBS7814209.1 RNA pyrophosphohydrolase [Wohlfahrtiimonas chitiniclastica]MBS7816749.1 RNA pyrophosphohydrolase [Wohlfahrtiimonas chitiniclastica]